MDTFDSIALIYGAMIFLFWGAFMRIENKVMGPHADQPLATLMVALIWPVMVLIIVGASLVPNKD